MMNHLRTFEGANPNINLFGFVGDDRKKILDFMGVKDWAVVMRKFHSSSYNKNRWDFQRAIRELRLCIGFMREYKDLYSDFFVDILRNPNYTADELIKIINTFPENINWYWVFYNKTIPIEFKKEHYDDIYRDMLLMYDINVPPDVRERNSKEALQVLEGYSVPRRHKDYKGKVVYLTYYLVDLIKKKIVDKQLQRVDTITYLNKEAAKEGKKWMRWSNASSYTQK